MATPSRTQPTTRVSIEREGVGQQDIQLQQVTVENLRRLFQVTYNNVIATKLY